MEGATSDLDVGREVFGCGDVVDCVDCRDVVVMGCVLEDLWLGGNVTYVAFSEWKGFVGRGLWNVP